MTSVQRRDLRFNSIDEISAEVDRLAATDVKTTGQFSFGEILEHLARSLDIDCGHSPGPKVALPLRMLMRVARPILLRGPMRPGFKLPSKAQSVLWPSEPIENSAGLAHFRESSGRYKSMTELPSHIFFGNMTRLQHDRLQCNHCALHLSFVRPVVVISD